MLVVVVVVPDAPAEEVGSSDNECIGSSLADSGPAPEVVGCTDPSCRLCGWAAPGGNAMGSRKRYKVEKRKKDGK